MIVRKRIITWFLFQEPPCLYFASVQNPSSAGLRYAIPSHLPEESFLSLRLALPPALYVYQAILIVSIYQDLNAPDVSLDFIVRAPPRSALVTGDL
jgi:hypothetical protein